jgi:hypothetical protein
MEKASIAEHMAPTTHLHWIVGGWSALRRNARVSIWKVNAGMSVMKERLKVAQKGLSTSVANTSTDGRTDKNVLTTTQVARIPTIAITATKICNAAMLFPNNHTTGCERKIRPEALVNELLSTINWPVSASH